MTAATRQILNRAADLVEQGWTQGHYYEWRDGRDCYCTMGAINAPGSQLGIQLSRDGLDYRQAATDAKTALSAIETSVRAKGYNSIGAWNDAPNRTQSEVVALLRSVAAQP